MMRLVLIRATVFLCSSACSVLAQQIRQNPSWNSLPDAPSANVSRMLVDETHLSLVSGGVGTGEVEMGLVNGGQIALTSFDSLNKQDPAREDSNDPIERYLYSKLRKRNPSYHSSMSGSFIGRASYAASSIFVTQDESGRSKLNTSYFVGVLSSAFVHTAYRPYWRRSVSEPFSDFGSNIGSDAGMNFLHEFGPGIEHMMKSHAPRLISKIEQSISHN